MFTESVLDHEHFDIRKSNAMTHKIISINRLRIAVTFLQGTFHPKHSTVSLFDISVELSPFAVKSMFWLSSEPIRLQEISYPDLLVARTDEYFVRVSCA